MKFIRMPNGDVLNTIRITKLKRMRSDVFMYREPDGVCHYGGSSFNSVRVVGYLYCHNEASAEYYFTEKEYTALEAVLLRDDTTLVHADWLEEHGHAEAAAALRKEFANG